MKRASRTVKVDDPFHIPDFLKIPQARRDAAWERNPPKAMPFVAVRRTHELSPETQALIDAEQARKKQKSLNRLKAWKDAGSIQNGDTRGMRWNPRRCRFEPDPRYAMSCVPGEERNAEKFKPVNDEPQQVNGQTPKHPANSRPGLSVSRQGGGPASIDDLGVQVSERFGTDAARLEAFARANQVWDDKYAALSNGLRRMNVVNRLRGKVRKGQQVVWPEGGVK